MQNVARTSKQLTETRGTRLAQSVQCLFGRPRPVMFDVLVSPRRQHTPDVRIELATPDPVKKHVNEVMDGWMRNIEAVRSLGDRYRTGSLPLSGPCRHQQIAG
jgi:hypothetical protein